MLASHVGMVGVVVDLGDDLVLFSCGTFWLCARIRLGVGGENMVTCDGFVVLKWKNFRNLGLLPCSVQRVKNARKIVFLMQL